MSAPPSIDDFLEPVGAEASEAPGAVAGVVRDYLRAVRSHLRELHERTASGSVVNEAHSDLIDRLVRRLFERAEERYFAGGGTEVADLTVLAVGGYARREMSVDSDVDLLFLYRDRVTPHVSAVAERLQYWLWDASLSVGGATRTIAETIQLAREDATVRTALLEPRFLVGSGVLYHEFADRLRSELVAQPEKFIEEQVRALEARHAEYGESLYLLQPNVKNGTGGLRDYHVSYWVMQATQRGARGCEDFLHMGLLTEDEVREYRAALDFLWRVRNELHLIGGRKNDQMSFELQERIAESFGYAEAAADQDLPVERFMRDYYRHARAIRTYSSLVIEQCQARVRRRPRKRSVKVVEDGFRISDGQLEVPHARMLKESPVRLLTAFAVAQDHDVQLTRKARRLIRESLHLIDDAFRASPEARAAFLRILGAEHRVMRSLAAMNEIGLLGRFLPEWEHIVCRWQHVIYHTYTVDVHSIFLVEELRRLWRSRYEATLPDLTALMRDVDDRPVLYLGCLLHDLGKGTGEDHSAEGARRARVCMERLGLSPERVERVVFLVRHHLLMSHLAQRRDLSDPKLVLDFARTVGDRINLRNLYLLTFADIRASSASGWTAWKGQLLRELYERTAEFLEAGFGDAALAFERIERRVETRRDSAAAELKALGVAESNVQAYFEMMPRRYFTAHSPRQIARHARVVLGFGPERIVSTAVREMRGGFSELILCTRDVHGLFSNVAGTLTAHDLNILGAHVYTTRSGLALEVYRIGTPRGGEDERRLKWSEFEASLEAVLTGRARAEELMRRRGRPFGRAVSPSAEPPSVGVTNDESDFYTIVDVAANDRLGLLHDLTRVIAEHGYQIFISKAATIMDQVTDTFYVKDQEGKKIQDPEAMDSLRQALLDSVCAGEARDGG